MIMAQLDDDKKIKSVDYAYTRQTGVLYLCPKCYNVWRIRNGTGVTYRWIKYNLIGKSIQDTISVPCGCKLSIGNIIHNTLEIDELIAKPISKFNKAGYTTTYSCSGHLEGYPGYVSFKHLFPELIDYVKNDTSLINLLNIEITVHNTSRKNTYILDKCIWDKNKKEYYRIDSFDYTNKNNQPKESMVIRMTKPRKYSRLECMLLFRRMLLKIASWCEKNKVYRTNDDLNARSSISNSRIYAL